MKSMFYRLLAMLIIMAGVSQAAQVRVVDDSARTSTLAAVTSGGKSEVQVREMRASMTASGAAPKLFDVLVLYDPQSGLFWWSYRATSDQDSTNTTDDFSAASKVFIGDGAIVVFSFYSPTLWVRQSSDRQSGLDQAQATALAGLASLGTAAGDGSAQLFKRVDLKGSLDADFFYRKNSASRFPSATLSSISRQGQQWRVVLNGPNGDRAIMVLDDQYSLVKIEGPTQGS